MIRMIFIGVWVCALVTGSAYFFNNYTHTASQAEGEDVKPDSIMSVNIDAMSIAMIRNSVIVGYLIVEPIIIVNRELNSELAVPVKYYARDVIISTVHKSEDIDTYQLDKFNLEEFQKRVVANLNTSIGLPLVHNVLIQNIDFITKEDVRDLKLRRS